MRRADAAANDLLVSLIEALSCFDETESVSQIDRAVAGVWMLHVAEVRPVNDEQAQGIVADDRDVMGRVEDVVRRLMKRRVQARPDDFGDPERMKRQDDALQRVLQRRLRSQVGDSDED